ncbi:ExeA family protein [Chitiniphilus shinanonensis]|uniref:ExeA family protein n=1 Tax=Chitiniphilus shinanonensis TaxID=553088 RepID=UPI00306AA61F
MLVIKTLLEKAKHPQSLLAAHLGLSRAAVAQMVNHDEWPKTRDLGALQGEILCYLRETVGYCLGDLDDAFEEWTPTRANAPGSDPQPEVDAIDNEPEKLMLLAKQHLQPGTRQHFGLAGDPFEEVRDADEVFASPSIRYVRESMMQVAKRGGFLAVVGESGAGKSTLRRDLINRIQQQQLQVVVIEPFVLAMEDNDIKGKTLKSNHIAESIMAALVPLTKPKTNPEARFRQVFEALRASSRSGNSHLLVIEEAHSLPLPTLKHLKRFFELEDGFKKLLGIVLIGQSELALKLDERNPAVREVVQRCEMVTLQPLGEHLKPYLAARFARIGRPLEEVIDDDALDALAVKLSGRDQQTKSTYSALYPLAVHNVLTAAMNTAAEYSVPRVTADVVREV